MPTLILRPEFPNRWDVAKASSSSPQVQPTKFDINDWVRDQLAQRGWQIQGDSVSMDVTVMEGEQRDE